MKYSQTQTRGYQYCCIRCNVLIIEGKQDDALINKLPICDACDKKDKDSITARRKEKFNIDEKTIKLLAKRTIRMEARNAKKK